MGKPLASSSPLNRLGVMVQKPFQIQIGRWPDIGFQYSLHELQHALVFFRVLRLWFLDRGSTTGNQLQDQNDQRYDQQQMYQAATYATDQTQQPQNHQYYQNCPQHAFAPVLSWNTVIRLQK